jgi:hypothetical protein
VGELSLGRDRRGSVSIHAPTPRGTAVGTAYNLGRIGSTISPLLIGLAATDSIGPGLGLLGISYAICALIPSIFIQEKLFDPKSVEAARASAPRPFTQHVASA